MALQRYATIHAERPLWINKFMPVFLEKWLYQRNPDKHLLKWSMDFGGYRHREQQTGERCMYSLPPYVRQSH